MLEQGLLTRRALAAVLPLAALAGTAPAASAAISTAIPAVEPTTGLIEQAAHRCRAAREALTRAIDGYERSLPPLHSSLDMTHHRPQPFRAGIERRQFDGATPKRGIDFRGNPGHRYVATVETIADDLACGGSRKRRGQLYRMRRRAKERVARIAALEAIFGLELRNAELQEAEHALEELTEVIFVGPVSTFAEVLMQAKALSSYADTIEAGHAKYQAGRFGAQLAESLQKVAGAA